MAGYRRVNFYELCRLCATNNQKQKTHIFQEQGRKIQLQNKIQTCLSLKVQEDDFLPKVVCTKCLQSLEVCLTFRQECLKSETMLSSYFKNFRYTEDFKKSGKVYIKDTKSGDYSACEMNTAESVSSTSVSTISNKIIVKPEISQLDQLSLYALQLPTNIVPSSNQKNSKLEMDIDTKISTNVSSTNYSTTQLPTFSLNTINLSAIKTIQNNSQKFSNEMLNNVVVNANGEVINIGHLVDLETVTSSNQNKNNEKTKKKVPMVHKEDISKIDLTNAENINNAVNFDTGQMKHDKLPHIKSTNTNKLTYTIKMDNDRLQNQPNTSQTSSTVVYNPTSTQYNSFNNFNSNTSNTILYSQNINLNTTSVSADNLTTNSNIISNSTTATTAEGSTVNINVLSNHQVSPSNFQSRHNNAYSNISSIPVTAVEDRKIFVQTIINSVPENSVNIVTTNNTNTTSNVSTNTKKIINNGANEKSHVCEICLKSFKRREHLYQHVKLHTGFRPFVCEYCNKAFMRKEHLLRHMTLHSGQKNFTCNICDKSFSRNDNLLKHKKTHEKQTNYECEVCLKTFVMKHYYVAHKMTHNVNSVWDMLKA